MRIPTTMEEGEALNHPAIKMPLLILALLDLVAGSQFVMNSHEPRHLVLAGLLFVCATFFLCALVAPDRVGGLRDYLSAAAVLNLLLSFAPVTFVICFATGTGRGGAGAVELVVGLGLASLCLIVLKHLRSR